MDTVDRNERAWEADDYLTSLDRFFEIEAMEEWTSNCARTHSLLSGI